MGRPKLDGWHGDVQTTDGLWWKLDAHRAEEAFRNAGRRCDGNRRGRKAHELLNLYVGEGLAFSKLLLQLGCCTYAELVLQSVFDSCIAGAHAAQSEDARNSVVHDTGRVAAALIARYAWRHKNDAIEDVLERWRRTLVMTGACRLTIMGNDP